MTTQGVLSGVGWCKVGRRVKRTGRSRTAHTWPLQCLRAKVYPGLVRSYLPGCMRTWHHAWVDEYLWAHRG